MKIAIDAREFQAGRMTGIGRYLWHFLQYTTSTNSPHEYVLFCNQNTHVPLDLPKLKKVNIPEKITLIWDQILLPVNISKENIDIFLTPYFKAPLFAHSKMILIINDLIPLFFPEEHGLFTRRYFRIMCGMAARRASRLITISENSRDDIMKFFNLPSDKIEVVHLGVEERFKQTDIHLEEIRKKYALPQRYLLYVGNLSPHKNVRGLINSYAALPLNLREHYKLVLGTSPGGKHFSPVEKAIRETELDHDIFFTGFIEDKDLPAVYRMSSLFVFPSFYEGFGLPPLEAMACGCPVVSSRVSSMPEVLGDAALYFNPYDAEEISSVIKKMLENDNLREKYSHKGLERAELFTTEKMATGILNVIESVTVNLK